jgi:hypothetical protein
MLAQSIGFVFDPTGLSGTPTSAQVMLRDELRQRVAVARPEHKWIDIISKIDHPSGDLASLQDTYGSGFLLSCCSAVFDVVLRSFHCRLGDSPHFSVSAQTNKGLMELGAGIRQVLTESASEDGLLE